MRPFPADDQDAVASFLSSTQALSGVTRRGGPGGSHAPSASSPATSSPSPAAEAPLRRRPLQQQQQPSSLLSSSRSPAAAPPTRPPPSSPAPVSPPTPLTRTSGFVSPNKPWWLGRYLKQHGEAHERAWKAHRRPHLLTISNVSADPRLDISFEPDPGNAKRKLQAKTYLTGPGTQIGFNQELGRLLLPPAAATPGQREQQDAAQEWTAFQFETLDDFNKCIARLSSIRGVSLKHMSADLNLDRPPVMKTARQMDSAGPPTPSDTRKRSAPSDISVLEQQTVQAVSQQQCESVVIPDLDDPEVKAYALSLLRGSRAFVGFVEVLEAWLCTSAGHSQQANSSSMMI